MLRTFQIRMALAAAVALWSCRTDKADPVSPTTAVTDQALYALAQNPSFAYYKGQNVLLPPQGDSPHGPFKLRFNARALSVLGADGKLPVGAVFPDSSIVLKETYQNGALQFLVPMLKLPGNASAGSGWVWGEYLPDGTVVHSVNNKGQGCIGCHSGGTNRDLIRSFDLH